MDDLRDITLFVAVARARSLSAVAARLTLPASTLSRQIAEQEQGLGTKLVHRTTHRVDLTGAGPCSAPAVSGSSRPPGRHGKTFPN